MAPTLEHISDAEKAKLEALLDSGKTVRREGNVTRCCARF
jgi:hypothetical protein